MIGRIGVQPAKSVGIFRRAVFRNPQPGDQKLVIADHVQQRHLADDGPEQVRPLRQSGPHEQTAVGPALDGQVVRIGVSLSDEPLGRSEKIVEDILLVAEHARLVPFLAVLAAAAQIGNGHQASLLQK